MRRAEEKSGDREKARVSEEFGEFVKGETGERQMNEESGGEKWR